MPPLVRGVTSCGVNAREGEPEAREDDTEEAREFESVGVA